ncbi:MAG TPA: hypothetical protein VLF43_02825 [Candidatus Saccharimonadales bacterium]|nr:hypothetical protein [Candidatus Saccharimonadales bacterium]
MVQPHLGEAIRGVDEEVTRLLAIHPATPKIAGAGKLFSAPSGKTIGSVDTELIKALREQSSNSGLDEPALRSWNWISGQIVAAQVRYAGEGEWQGQRRLSAILIGRTAVRRGANPRPAVGITYGRTANKPNWDNLYLALGRMDYAIPPSEPDVFVPISGVTLNDKSNSPTYVNMLKTIQTVLATIEPGKVNIRTL